jgi:flagellar biosynthesis GTPase FlhF
VPDVDSPLKSYEGISEASAKVRLYNDLGRDAEVVEVIHQQPLLGLLGFGKVTVLGRAAIKQENEDRKKSKTRTLDTTKAEGQNFLSELHKASNPGLKKTRHPHPMAYDSQTDQDDLIQQFIFAAREQARRTESRNSSASPSPYSLSSSGLSRTRGSGVAPPAFSDELKDIKTVLKSLSQEISLLKRGGSQSVGAVQPRPNQESGKEVAKLGGYEELTEVLLGHEFDLQLIEVLIEALREENKDRSEPSLSDLKTSVRRKLVSNLKPKHKPPLVSGSEFKARKKPEIMVFVGPTGVGKTTTLSKIASSLALEENPRSVAIITIDTFKVGGVEQIRFYAEGLNVELEVVYKPEKILPAIERHSDKDVILIDTIGRGHKSTAEIASLKAFLPESIKSEVHLVMSATAKYRDMVDTLKAYNHLGVDCLLFTKLDETSTFGPMLSVLQRSRTQMISYVATGQRVPGDLREADPEYLSNLMFQSHH